MVTLSGDKVTRAGARNIPSGRQYVSQKIPFAYDYAEGDFGVGNLSSAGTAAASAAAGAYLGKGDVQQEDGKVVRDADFFGAAPDAQLLLMKAAKDNDAEMTSENVAAAIRDAISLGADVILLNLARAQTDGEAEEALRLAARAGVPVFAGTGDLSSLQRSLHEKMPAAIFDRGMMPAGATAPSLVLVGALSDPYAHINHFLAGDVPVYYADSSLTYLGRSFGAFFAGQTVPLVAVPGVGTASDYEGLDAAGKIVLVSRGVISFEEKIETAAEKGAVEGQIALGTDSTVNPIQVSISQFYGIEINDFAVTVAKTALWIAESQMMKATEDIVHMDLDFLPLKSYANIIEANALRIDWNTVIPKEKLNYIVGNPPFVGYSLQSAEQKADMLNIYVDEKGKPYKTAGKIDYVAAWYFKAAEIMQNSTIRTALVSTNSITQGEQVAGVWKPLYERFGVHIDFAHRTFRWDSEANIKAHVHCVIVGFSCHTDSENLRFSKRKTEIELTERSVLFSWEL